MLNDISFLVSQTFEQVEKGIYSGKYLEEEARLEQPDELAGVIFHLERKVSTFVIRVEATDNLRETYHQIIKNPSEFSKLRLDTGPDTPIKNQIEYFVCDSVMHAELIKYQLANKRFPLFEESMMNISDPGDSWWFRDQGDKFTIHFQFSHMQNDGSLLKLGPLGDSDQVMANFQKLRGYFSILFPVSTYASGHGQMVMGTSKADDQVFKGIKDLFMTGETGHFFWDYLRKLEEDAREKDPKFLKSLLKANFFLMELATIRRFWMAIEKKL